MDGKIAVPKSVVFRRGYGMFVFICQDYTCLFPYWIDCDLGYTGDYRSFVKSRHAGFSPPATEAIHFMKNRCRETEIGTGFYFIGHKTSKITSTQDTNAGRIHTGCYVYGAGFVSDDKISISDNMNKIRKRGHTCNIDKTCFWFCYNYIWEAFIL